MSADPVSGLRARFQAMPARLRAEVADALREVGAAAVAEARRLLAGSNGPDPSQPGEPPRDRAGRLADTLSATVETTGSVMVAAAAPAPFLEYGTRVMAPRPFLRPAAAAVEPVMRDAFRDALARAARQEGDAQ